MADQDGRRLEIMTIVAALLFLELKRGLTGEGGGGVASGAPAQSQSVKKCLVWIGLIYLSCSIPTVIWYLEH